MAPEGSRKRLELLKEAAPHIIALISGLRTAMPLFDSRTTELYSEAYGCLLPVGCVAWL